MELHRYLQAGREALLWKLGGLSEYDARRPMVPTGTNLLGVVKHVASVDAGYFGETFGRPFEEPIPWLDDSAVVLNGSTQLTCRQHEILELVASGLSTKEIARELSLSIETVRNHLRRILHALGVHTRVEAVVTAQRLGLLPPRPLRP